MDFIDFESYYMYIYTYTHTYIYIYYNSCVEEPWYQIEYSQLLQIKDMTVCHRGVRGQNKLSKFLWNNMLNAYTAGFSLKPRDAEIRCKQGPCHKVLQNQACHERIQSIRASYTHCERPTRCWGASTKPVSNFSTHKSKATSKALKTWRGLGCHRSHCPLSLGVFIPKFPPLLEPWENKIEDFGDS